MATTSTDSIPSQTQRPREFLDLPAEVHKMIVDNLRFPELQRLRGTCHYLRKFGSALHILNSFELLERDFRGNSRTAAWALDRMQRVTRSNASTARLNAQLSDTFGSYTTDHQALVDLGYSTDDTIHLATACSLCKGCRRIVRINDMCRTATRITPLGRPWPALSRPPAISITYRPPTVRDPWMPRNVCAPCFLSYGAFQSLSTPYLRWTHTRKYAVVKCLACGQGKYYYGVEKRVGHEQKLTGQCHECWKKNRPRWLRRWWRRVKGKLEEKYGRLRLFRRKGNAK